MAPIVRSIRDRWRCQWAAAINIGHAANSRLQLIDIDSDNTQFARPGSARSAEPKRLARVRDRSA